jgi:hypothetical protein
VRIAKCVTLSVELIDRLESMPSEIRDSLYKSPTEDISNVVIDSRGLTKEDYAYIQNLVNSSLRGDALLTHAYIMVNDATAQAYVRQAIRRNNKALKRQAVRARSSRPVGAAVFSRILEALAIRGLETLDNATIKSGRSPQRYARKAAHESSNR